MMRNRLVAAMAIAVLCFSAVAVAAPENKTIVGTISSLDNSQKSMVVKDTSGTETTVYGYDSARIAGGDLREGATVKVSTREQDGKTFAVSIEVQQPKKPY